MTLAIPTTDASSKATGATIDRLRAELPKGSLIGGAAAENHDLEKVLSARTPLVFGLLVGLGFLLLLIALGSPLVAFVGVVTNLASIAAAFGVAKWIFQDGHLSGLLNFQPQGFVDAWAPLFFGAMLTGVAMDYTLFLLSAAREHYDLTGDPQHAMRMALRTSGRVVVAAAGVMVAVFLTFALSGPLAPKEMGIILAVAVFLDALCIRLILLPVVLRLTGHGAWYQPKWLGRILPERPLLALTTRRRHPHDRLRNQHHPRSRLRRERRAHPRRARRTGLRRPHRDRRRRHDEGQARQGHGAAPHPRRLQPTAGPPGPDHRAVHRPAAALQRRRPLARRRRTPSSRRWTPPSWSPPPATPSSHPSPSRPANGSSPRSALSPQ